MKEFTRKFGKLVEPVAVPLDSKMHKEVARAKANGFKFNEWARELWLKHWDDIEKAASEKQEAS